MSFKDIFKLVITNLLIFACIIVSLEFFLSTQKSEPLVSFVGKFSGAVKRPENLLSYYNIENWSGDNDKRLKIAVKSWLSKNKRPEKELVRGTLLDLPFTLRTLNEDAEVLLSGAHSNKPYINHTFGKYVESVGKWKTKFQVTTDQNGIRKSIPNHKSKKEIAFIGCSFTFGDGVDDNLTFPSRFSKYISDRHVKNFGLMGSSPLVILDSLMNEKILSFADLIDEEGLIVLTLIDDHIRRVTGSSIIYSELHNPQVIPGYKFSSNNELIAYDRQTTLRYKVLKNLGESSIFKKFRIELPVFDDAHYEHTAKIINEIKKRVSKKNKFVVSLYPGEYIHLPRLIKYFEKYNINYIDLSRLDIESILNGHNWLINDGHPSPLAYDFYAFILSKELSHYGYLD